MPRDVELILLKQLASCLAIPMFVADTEGSDVMADHGRSPDMAVPGPVMVLIVPPQTEPDKEGRGQVVLQTREGENVA